MPEVDADLVAGARRMIALHRKNEAYYSACDQWARLEGLGGGNVKGLQDYYEARSKFSKHLWRHWAKLLIEDFDMKQGVPAAPEMTVDYGGIGPAIADNIEKEQATLNAIEEVLNTARLAKKGGGIFERYALKRIGESKKTLRQLLEFKEQVALAGQDRAALMKVNEFIGKQAGH